MYVTPKTDGRQPTGTFRQRKEAAVNVPVSL